MEPERRLLDPRSKPTKSQALEDRVAAPPCFGQSVKVRRRGNLRRGRDTGGDAKSIEPEGPGECRVVGIGFILEKAEIEQQLGAISLGERPAGRPLKQLIAQP